MKFALLLGLIGLQAVAAISPFETIVEEWEVSISLLCYTSLTLLSSDLEAAAREGVHQELRRPIRQAEPGGELQNEDLDGEQSQD